MPKFKPGDRDEPKWYCRRCRGVFSHNECATRFGIVECPICIYQAYVGLLEKFDPAAAIGSAEWLEQRAYAGAFARE